MRMAILTFEGFNELDWLIALGILDGTVMKNISASLPQTRVTVIRARSYIGA